MINYSLTRCRILHLAILLSYSLLLGCAPGVSTKITKQGTPIQKSERFIIYGIDEPLPDQQAEDLGIVRIYDNGFSANCGYEKVVSLAVDAARKAGGNAIKIMEHNPPTIWGSSCHQIVAKILWFPDMEKIASTHVNSEQITENPDSSITIIPTAEARTNETPTNVPRGKGFKEPFQKWRLGIGGGYSYRLAQVPDDIPTFYSDYLKDLKQGFNLDGDFTYFLSRGIGLGLKYSFNHSSNQLSDISLEFEEPDTTLTGDMADNVFIHFIGPMVCFRSVGKTNENAFFMNLAIGYMPYLNKSIFIYDFRITGGTVGMGIDIGYDFALSKNLAIGLQLSLVGGTIHKFTIDDGTTKEEVTLDKDSYEGLGRIDAGVLLRFRK